MKIKDVLSKITNVLFPDNITCFICGEDCDKEREVDICSSCMQSLPYNDGKICLRCGNALDDNDSCSNCKFTKHYFVKARAPFIYAGEIRSAIQRLKFNGEKYIAKSLAFYLIDVYKQLEIDADYIVPIPASSKRLKQRGYNQAELLARELAESVGVCCSTNLEKSIDTVKQSNVDIKERKANVENVFIVKDRKLFKGKVIVLVDDVFTTGATVDSASKELRKAGAKAVFVITVAHTKFEKNNLSN